jgi:hypothetical protein
MRTSCESLRIKPITIEIFFTAIRKDVEMLDIPNTFMKYSN